MIDKCMYVCACVCMYVLVLLYFVKSHAFCRVPVCVYVCMYLYMNHDEKCVGLLRQQIRVDSESESG